MTSLIELINEINRRISLIKDQNDLETVRENLAVTFAIVITKIDEVNREKLSQKAKHHLHIVRNDDI